MSPKDWGFRFLVYIANEGLKLAFESVGVPLAERCQGRVKLSEKPKTTLSPDGRPVNQGRWGNADATLVKALVRPHRCNRWLAEGRCSNVRALAAAEGITRPGYASRILRLALLAPDVLESILFARQPCGLTMSQLMN